METDLLDETLTDLAGSESADSVSTEGTDVEGPRPSALYVCPYIDSDTGDVCGRDDFTSLRGFNAHTMAVHGYTHDGKKTKGGKGKPRGGDKEPARSTKTETKAEAKKALGRSGGSAVTDANRAAMYTQSLAMLGLIAHVAVPGIDDYDASVWAAGTPGLANALDAVGESNEGVRRLCDMLLAGGGGGAYVQLVVAVATIAAPIAAHHGLLPQAVGERFGTMIGVMAPAPVSPVPSPATPQPEQAGPGAPGHLDPSHWTFEEWQTVLSQVPTHVVSDLTRQMMGSDGSISVTIPGMAGTTPMDIPTEEHRGSVGANGTADESPDDSVQQPA